MGYLKNNRTKDTQTTSDMSKKHALFVTASVIICIVIILTIVIISLPSSQSSGITALEGFPEAKEVAGEKYDVVYLENVKPESGAPDFYGKSEAWRYYFVGQEEGNLYEGFTITIYFDGKNDSYCFGVANHTPTPILNWTIDSDNAMEVAKSSQEINSFLSKYEDAKVEGFQLRMDSLYSTNAIWDIRWHSSGFMDDPHNARIIIDASTGEVLEVEVQMD